MPLTQYRIYKSYRLLRALAVNGNARRQLPKMVKLRRANLLESRKPWLAFDLTKFLEPLLPGARVLEYGGGGSTAWLLDNGATVWTVESDPAWYELLTASIGDDPRSNIELIEPRNGVEEYVRAGLGRDERFDVVFVDGRERVHCAEFAQHLLNPRGLLIVDDLDRQKYRTGLIDSPPFKDWPFLEFEGFAPGKVALARTGVWIRP